MKALKFIWISVLVLVSCAFPQKEDLTQKILSTMTLAEFEKFVKTVEGNIFTNTPRCEYYKASYGETLASCNLGIYVFDQNKMVYRKDSDDEQKYITKFTVSSTNEGFSRFKKVFIEAVNKDSLLERKEFEKARPLIVAGMKEKGLVVVNSVKDADLRLYFQVFNYKKDYEDIKSKPVYNTTYIPGNTQTSNVNIVGSNFKTYTGTVTQSTPGSFHTAYAGQDTWTERYSLYTYGVGISGYSMKENINGKPKQVVNLVVLSPISKKDMSTFYKPHAAFLIGKYLGIDVENEDVNLYYFDPRIVREEVRDIAADVERHN